MGRYNILLIGMAFSVILGVLLVSIPEVLNLELGAPRYRTFWLLSAIFMFIEFFVVFNTSFLGLKITYRNSDLFQDLILGMWFTLIVTKIISSLEQTPYCYVGEEYLCKSDTALVLNTAFLLLFANIRIGLIYQRFKKSGEWTDQRKKFVAKIGKREEAIFRAPVISNFIGILVCVPMFLIVKEGTIANGEPMAYYLSAILFLTTLVYYLFRHPIKT